MRPAGARAAIPPGSRPGGIDLAEIFRSHGAAFRRTHRLTRAQRRAMRAIELCRTAALGGHRDVCDHCGTERLSYNSCRNRHCPKCQSLATARWLEARRAELLPVEYFHVVFTLPHALDILLDRHARLIYTLLFRTAAATLSTFAHDPRHLGGELGVTAVLTAHVHLHCIVTGGALALDGSRWIPAKPGFLFPVRALAQVFRAKYLAALDRAAVAGTLALPEALSRPGTFDAWLASLRQPTWVVYAKSPFAGPEHVLQYLGRYTHKLMALPAEEFIRRFLLHIVPERFVRIRHFGFLANRTRQTKLARCRQLLRQPEPVPAPPAETVPALLLRLTGIDIERCPVCGQGRLAAVQMLRPIRPARPPLARALDTS